MRKSTPTCLLLGATLGMCVVGAKAAAQSFSGRWLLDVKQSRLATADPPVWGEDTITFDGNNWHFQEVLRDAAGRSETRSIALKLGASGRVDKDGLLTTRSRIYREGGTLVVEQISSTSVEKIPGKKIRGRKKSEGKQTIRSARYSLTPDNDTLLVFDQDETPTGNQSSHWVFERELTP